MRSPKVLVIFLFKQNNPYFLPPLLSVELDCSKRQTKWGSLFPSRNAALERHSTPAATVCMVLCPGICLSRALLTLWGGTDVCGWVGALGRQPGEQQLCRNCGWQVMLQWWHSCEVSPEVSHQRPEGQCTRGGPQLLGKGGSKVQERKEGQAIRQWCRRTVFMSGALSRRMQMGKPKELFHWTHFPFFFLCISLFTSCLAGSAAITTIFLLTCAICIALYVELSLPQCNANDKYLAMLWASAPLSLEEGVTCRSRQSSA